MDSEEPASEFAAADADSPQALVIEEGVDSAVPTAQGEVSSCSNTSCHQPDEPPDGCSVAESPASPPAEDTPPIEVDPIDDASLRQPAISCSPPQQQSDNTEDQDTAAELPMENADVPQDVAEPAPAEVEREVEPHNECHTPAAEENVPNPSPESPEPKEPCIMSTADPGEQAASSETPVLAISPASPVPSNPEPSVECMEVDLPAEETRTVNGCKIVVCFRLPIMFLFRFLELTSLLRRKEATTSGVTSSKK